jgi:large subunit ribosomal protein L3
MTTTGIIAKKIGMTRMVDAEGQMTPVTLLQVEPQRVTKILTPERDGYHGIQVGYYVKSEKHLNKPDIHRLRKASIADNFTRFKEFRLEGAPEGVEVGTAMSAGLLEGVPAIDATGITKGRGFAGAHQLHNAAVGRMSHGSRFHRSPGSLGMRSTPGRVFKNRPQPGHMGTDQVTVQNLDVMDIDTENNVIAVRGSVPGHRDGFLVLAPSVKIKKPKKSAQAAKK